MDGVLEAVLSQRPFRMMRTARWSECDPAGIVHASRYGDFISSACDLYLDTVWGGSARATKRASGVRTPLRSLTIDYERSLRPEGRFFMEAALEGATERGLTVTVRGSDAEGALLFEGTVTFACVDLDNGRSTPWPDTLRQALDRAAAGQD